MAPTMIGMTSAGTSSATIGVSTMPGWTELTRIPAPANSMAAPSVAWGAVAPPLPMRPWIDEVSMMEPPPARRIASATTFIPSQTPVWSVAMIRAHHQAGPSGPNSAAWVAPCPRAAPLVSTTLPACLSPAVVSFGVDAVS